MRLGHKKTMASVLGTLSLILSLSDIFTLGKESSPFSEELMSLVKSQRGWEAGQYPRERAWRQISPQVSLRCLHPVIP